MNEKKGILREQILRERNALPPYQCIEAGEAAAKLALTHSVVTHAKHLGIYMPIHREISSVPLINHLANAHKHLYLPCMKEGLLEFRLFKNTPSLHPNVFGILEPDLEAPVCPLIKLEVVIVPLVAFDVRCNSLGLGKGFYDKTFAFKNPAQKPFLIGLAYEFQKVDAVPVEGWDIPLNAVLTEKRYYFNSLCPIN